MPSLSQFFYIFDEDALFVIKPLMKVPSQGHPQPCSKHTTSASLKIKKILKTL